MAKYSSPTLLPATRDEESRPLERHGVGRKTWEYIGTGHDKKWGVGTGSSRLVPSRCHENKYTLSHETPAPIR